jgi:multicomponent K+:H+ antiporter subunit D
VNHLPILPLMVPLLAAIALALLREWSMPVRRTISLAANFVLFLVALRLLGATSGGEIEVYRLGNWPAPYGIVLVADRLAAVMVVATALLSLCVVCHAALGADRCGRYFHLLFQLQLFGLNGAFLTGDLFNLFVFFEVLLIASYGLLLQGGGRPRTRAGLHYVVLNVVGSILFLFAAGTLFGVLGTLNMADLAQRMTELAPQHVGVVRAAGLLLFVVFALKAALVPLHSWLPAAYANANAPVAALFAIMTKVGAYAILRVSTLIFGDSGVDGVAGLTAPWLLPLALATIVVGAVGVTTSASLSKLAAFLVIVSAGTLLTAFGLGGVEAVAAGLYYLLHSTFAVAALFLLADVIGSARGELRDRLAVGPAPPRADLLGVLFLVSAVAIAGVPPLSGFLGKLLVLEASLGSPWMPSVLGVVLTTSLAIIFSLARSGSRIFFVGDDGVAAASGARGRLDLAPLLALMAIGGLLVVFAGPVLEFTQATAEQLCDPGSYVRAVMMHPAEVGTP